VSEMRETPCVNWAFLAKGVPVGLVVHSLLKNSLWFYYCPTELENTFFRAYICTDPVAPRVTSSALQTIWAAGFLHRKTRSGLKIFESIIGC